MVCHWNGVGVFLAVLYDNRLLPVIEKVGLIVPVPSESVLTFGTRG
jgi:hypothetical protein